MMTKIKTLLVVIFFIPPTLGNEIVPELIDISIKKNHQGLYLEPAEIKINQDDPYLMVINNEADCAIDFIYGEFGRSVSTLFLDGVLGLHQYGLNIPIKTKVTWHFVSKTPGEFKYQLIKAGEAQISGEGKWMIDGLTSNINSSKENDLISKEEKNKKMNEQKMPMKIRK